MKIIVTLIIMMLAFVTAGWLQIEETTKPSDDTKVVRRVAAIFYNGHIQVGQPNFTQLIITKSETSGIYIGLVREKEGIY